MNKYQVKINGKVIEVEVEMLGESPVVTAVQPKPAKALHRDAATPAARTVSAPAPVMEKSAAAAAADEGKAVTAPMPGNILDVLVKIGDAKLGQDRAGFVFVERPEIRRKVRKDLLHHGEVVVHHRGLGKVGHLHIGVPGDFS